MATKYVMPKLAMAMNEGIVSEWLVQHGEKVEKGQPLASIETEKVSYDVESPEAGYFCILSSVGESVPCDEVIGYFCETPEEVAALDADVGNAVEPPGIVIEEQAAIVKAPATNQGRIIASPLAKKIARDNSLNLSGVSGSGPGGRIVKRDVLARLEAGGGMSLKLSNVTSELARIPLQGVRKTIASRMMQSLQESAQLSSGWESDVTDLLAMRGKLVAREAALGTRVSVNALLARAMVYAIRQVPIANACIENGEIVIYNNINLGIAVAMPGTTQYDSTLVVAVLRNIESMGLAEIDTEMKELVKRVRSGSASAEDLSGSTITLSSTAGIAPPGMTTTPVLNLPNIALVGPSTPLEKPVFRDGEIVPRTMMPMSFTFDHRAIDGEPAARFMAALHDALENPELLMV